MWKKKPKRELSKKQIKAYKAQMRKKDEFKKWQISAQHSGEDPSTPMGTKEKIIIPRFSEKEER